MGAMEEGGRALNTFLDAMRVQPLALALVVMNCALLAYLFWAGREATMQRNQYIKETQQILASCIHADDLERVQRALQGR